MDNYSWTDKHIKKKQKAIAKYNLSASVCEPSQLPLCRKQQTSGICSAFHLVISTSGISILKSHPNFCNIGNLVMYKLLRIPVRLERNY